MPVDSSISDVIPADGIVLRATTVEMTITSVETAQFTAIVWAVFPDTGLTEMIWHGAGFTSRYPASTVEAVPDGFRFVLNRVGGWPGSPQFTITAYGEGGNMVQVQQSGTLIGERTAINLTGNVACTDDAGNDRVNIAVTTGTGGARSILGTAGNSAAARADIDGGGSASNVHVFSDDGTTVASRALGTLIDSDATRWTTVQDIDAGAWASTDFVSGGDGTVSVGGLTWNKANVSAADTAGVFRRNAADVGDDGGAGVRILHDASLLTTLTTVANSAPSLWIALSTIDPAYDETAEYVVQIQVTRLTETGSITNAQPTRLAMLLHAPSGTPTGTAVRVAGVAYRRSSAGVWNPCIETSGTTDTSRTDVPYDNATNNVLSLHFSSRGIQGYTGLYSGGWPTFASLTSLGFRASAQSTPNWSDVYNFRNTRLSIITASGVSNTGSIDTMWRRIRLLRRRA